MKSPNKILTMVFIFVILFAVYQLYQKNIKEREGIYKTEDAAELSPNQPLSEKPATRKDQLTSKEEQVSEKKGKKDFFPKEQRIKELIKEKNPFRFSKGINPYKESERNEDQQAGSDQLDYKKTTREKKDEKTFLDFTLTSIIIGKEKKIAIIDRAPFELNIGDVIQSERVLDILSDHIILSSNSDKRLVFLKFSNDSQIKMEGVK